jgi:SAM-dependent methyltransferase
MFTIVKGIARGILPGKTRSAISSYLERRAFDRFMAQKLDGFYTGVSDGPVPPPELTMKTSARDMDSFQRRLADPHVNRNVYLASGYHDAHNLLSQVSSHGFNLRTMRAIFDLGCGDGRLIRHFRTIDGIRLIGSDTRLEVIEWCQQNLPGPEYQVNQFCPPLGFLADSSIDLGYAFSVFTHIPLDTQETWVAEIHRVVRPGGFFLATVMGRLLKQFLPPHRRDELERHGELEIPSSDQDAHLATQIGGSRWDVYQSRGRIIEVFGKFFEVKDYLYGGVQDLLVLRKREARG